MDVLLTRCAGLDVHKKNVVACVRIVEGTKVTHEVRTFETTTSALMVLADWLATASVTHVAMEATGVYWKPVWHVLEGAFELVLANAAHIKNVPGRKTDVNDATWIADLVAHGLVRASFVPPTPVQEMRELMRTRKQLVREKVSHVERIQKTLESANIKIESELSDVMGQSGRAILDAIVAGVTDPNKLADLVNARVKAPRERLVEALRGRVTSAHRLLIRVHLGQVDSLDQAVATLEAEVGERLEPFRDKAELLKTMPGIGDLTARALLSEVGPDMSRFATAAHLVSWAGLCPRNDESAGKRRSNKIRKANPWLKPQLVQAAFAAIRRKGSYLRAQFHRLKARRGSKKAIIAVAASMLTAVWHMLTDGTAYQDLGSEHFNRIDAGKQARRLIRRLEELGLAVQVLPSAGAVSS